MKETSTSRKRSKEPGILTEVELELMTAVWGLPGECTVKDVQGALPSGRDLAYTSVATVMKILEHKGFLESRKKDKAHSYRPLFTKAEYESTSLRHLARNVFQGDAGSMAMKLLSDADLTSEELKSIRALLTQRLAGK
jgi:predicted transcriptional regulator